MDFDDCESVLLWYPILLISIVYLTLNDDTGLAEDDENDPL